MTLPIWTVDPFTPLTVANIQTEFGGNIPANISDYYSGTKLVGSGYRFGRPFGIETPIPLAGNTIAVSNFYGASKIAYTIVGDKLDYNEGETITFTVTSPDDDDTQLFWTIEDVSAELDLYPKVLDNAIRGRSYNAVIAAAYGSQPITYSLLTGSLPPGLSLTANGRISGRTLGSGTFLFGIKAEDSDCNTGHQVYAIDVEIPDIQILPEALDGVLRKLPMDITFTATGGDGPYTWEVISGNLPPGLTLSSDGNLTGRPTTAGNTVFRIGTTDSVTNVGSRAYFLNVYPVEIAISPSVLSDAKQDFSYTAQLSATGGQAPYVWSVVDSLPTGLTLDSSGLLSGTPSVNGIKTFTVKVVDANENDATKTYNLKIISNIWELSIVGFGNTAPISVNEGNIITVNVQSPETIDSTLTAYLAFGVPISNPTGSNAALGQDFTISTDEISIVNRQGSANIRIVEDAFTEGAEYFTLGVEYPRGTLKRTFGRINVVDTSLTPVFTANITPASANRASPVQLSWSTINPPTNSYVKIERFNSVLTNDTYQYPTTGDNLYPSPSTGGSDSLGGGLWTSQLRLFLANGFPVATATPSYSVAAATYSITPDKRFIYEGQTVTYQITTTNLANGTSLQWFNNGNTLAADFTDSQNSGTVTINNSTATLTRVAATNNGSLTSNATQRMNITIRGGSAVGPLLADSGDVLISGLQTFVITPDKTSANEGETITWNIVTTSIPNGTILYWKNTGTVAASDFTSNADTGTVVINNQTGSFSLTLKNDYSTEGSETIIIELRLTSQSGTLVATSSAVSVADTSMTMNEVVSGPANTGLNDNINISITGGAPNTTFSFTGNNGITPGSGTLDSSGNYTISNISFVPLGAGFYGYTFTFNATGHTRTYAIEVTGAPVAPTFVNGTFEVTGPVTTNGDEVLIPGWTVYLRRVRLSGFSNILGWPTPTDPTPSPLNAPTPYGDAPLDNPFNRYWEFANESPSGDGSKVLRLYSAGTVNAPYGILRGPYAVSESIVDAAVGDTVEFWWKAANGGDWFDVFAYLLNETNGQTVILLDQVGDTTNWAKASKVIGSGEAGRYRFIFICGSYDYTGGQGLGASLYIDEVKLIKA